MLHSLFNLDWSRIFLPDTPVLEIFLRGSIVYLFLFLLLRIVLKREAGTLGMTDLLVVVLLADAAQNAMAGDYRSLPDGLLLVSTIVFWAFALNWLGYHIPAVNRFVHPPALRLIQNGRMLRRNMRHELITEEELMGQLRQQGINAIDEVNEAFMEGDGRISVVTRNGRARGSPKRTAE